MASMGFDGIYGVFTGNAISRQNGIYGKKWHLCAAALEKSLVHAAALTQPKWIG
jgi:hypothetical protein